MTCNLKYIFRCFTPNTTANKCSTYWKIFAFPPHVELKHQVKDTECFFLTPGLVECKVDANLLKTSSAEGKKRERCIRAFFIPPWETLGFRAWRVWWWGLTRGSGRSRGSQITSSSESPQSPKRNESMFSESPTRQDLPTDIEFASEAEFSPRFWGCRASLSWSYKKSSRTRLDLILQPSAPVC